MKNKIIFLAVALCLFFSSNFLWVGESKAGDHQKVDGTITYRGNVVDPDSDKNFISHDVNSYFLIDKKYGLGMDTTFCQDKDYLRVKPYATWKFAKGLSLLGGFSTDSKDADYVQTSVWYFGSLGGKVNLFLDPRFFIQVNDSAASYFDGFAEATYLLNDKLALAVDIAYDHWWHNGNDWALFGPVVYYKISNSTTVFTRIARETNFEGGGSTDFRIGAKWSF